MTETRKVKVSSVKITLKIHGSSSILTSSMSSIDDMILTVATSKILNISCKSNTKHLLYVPKDFHPMKGGLCMSYQQVGAKHFTTFLYRLVQLSNRGLHNTLKGKASWILVARKLIDSNLRFPPNVPVPKERLNKKNNPSLAKKVGEVGLSKYVVHIRPAS